MKSDLIDLLFYFILSSISFSFYYYDMDCMCQIIKFRKYTYIIQTHHSVIKAPWERCDHRINQTRPTLKFFPLVVYSCAFIITLLIHTWFLFCFRVFFSVLICCYTCQCRVFPKVHQGLP